MMQTQSVMMMAGAAALLWLALRDDQGAGAWPFDPSEPYGPKWKTTRPPGWPEGHYTGTRDSALPAVEAWSWANSGDPAFVDAVRDLCRQESGCRWAMPANVYDSRCGAGQVSRPGRACVTWDGVRPSGRSFSTAEGPFSWRQDTYYAHLGRDGVLPVDRDPQFALELALSVYLDLWRQMKSQGWSDRYARRGIFYWHKRPIEARRIIASNIPTAMPAGPRAA